MTKTTLEEKPRIPKVKMTKIRWLNRSYIRGNAYTLCLSEKEFGKVIKNLGIPAYRPGRWVTHGKGATVHLCYADDGDRIGIVCVDLEQVGYLSELVGVLTHEAVHIWQDYCEGAGEANPSIEFEAYSIQCITQGLFTEFLRRKVEGIKYE